MMKKWKKYGLIGTAVLIVLVAVISSAFKSVDMETAVVKSTPVIATAVEKGRIVSEGTGDVFSQVQGRVKAVYVDEGDSVQPGTVLAEIDAGDIDAQIAQAEGELRAIDGSSSLSGASQVRQQQSALDQARVALNLAKDNYRRIQQLYSEGAATKAELEQAKADMDAKQKAVNQASAALESSKTQFAGQKESLTARLDYLRSQKGKARITAARSETVLIKKIKEGDVVSPGTLLFSLGSTDRIRIEAYVNSKDMANVRKGSPVTVQFKTPGKDIEAAGAVTKIAPSAEERLSSLGIMEDKIKVTIGLKTRPVGIQVLPGTGVDVTLVTQQTGKVLAVPKEAVFTDKGNDFVWVIRDGKAALAQVEAGIEGDELTEIKKGLSEGEKVVLNPHQDILKEGIRVR